ncbi:2650_t:CDS:2, partial [Cetraspora pellucida]
RTAPRARCDASVYKTNPMLSQGWARMGAKKSAKPRNSLNARGSWIRKSYSHLVQNNTCTGSTSDLLGTVYQK